MQARERSNEASTGQPVEVRQGEVTLKYESGAGNAMRINESYDSFIECLEV